MPVQNFMAKQLKYFNLDQGGGLTREPTNIAVPRALLLASPEFRLFSVLSVSDSLSTADQHYVLYHHCGATRKITINANPW